MQKGNNHSVGFNRVAHQLSYGMHAIKGAETIRKGLQNSSSLATGKRKAPDTHRFYLLKDTFPKDERMCHFWQKIAGVRKHMSR